MIITIGRQLGSGGREIGRRLSEDLQIAYYDREILEITAKQSGISRKLFEQMDERMHKRLPAGLFSTRFPFWGDPMLNYGGLSNEMLFQVMSDVIRSLAEKQSCIFIGRCADYILRDRNDCLNVFICANEQDRIRRIIENGKDKAISVEKARELMVQIDRQRASFYNYYSNKTWGLASSYHLCLNSSALGIDGAVSLIHTLLQGTSKILL